MQILALASSKILCSGPPEAAALSSSQKGGSLKGCVGGKNAFGPLTTFLEVDAR
jgi:hypothetical protein